MRTLIELVQIVKDIGLKKTDLLTTDKTNKTKSHQFYNKILEGDFKTDNDAAQFFF